MSNKEGIFVEPRSTHRDAVMDFNVKRAPHRIIPLVNTTSLKFGMFVQLIIQLTYMHCPLHVQLHNGCLLPGYSVDTYELILPILKFYEGCMSPGSTPHSVDNHVLLFVHIQLHECCPPSQGYSIDKYPLPPQKFICSRFAAHTPPARKLYFS